MKKMKTILFIALLIIMNVHGQITHDQIVTIQPSSYGPKLILNDVNTANKVPIEFRSNNNIKWEFGMRNLAGQNDLALWRFNGVYSTVMWFNQDNGNIGIGTTNPRSLLNLKNNKPNGAIISVEKYTPNEIIGGLRFGTGYDNFDDWSGIEAYGTGGYDQQDLRFYTTYGQRLERMRINQHGNIGIGTTNPRSLLNLKNNKPNGAIISVERYTPNEIIGGLRFGTGYDNFDDWSGIEAYGTGGYDQQDLRFYTTYGQRLERMRINQHGNIGIGTTNTGNHKLAVEGSIGAREIKVEAFPNWSDFVFDKEYNLPSLKEVENHIKEKGHLKDIPSAEEVEENGIFLGEMNAKLLQKIEELTLYTIAQEKKIEKDNESLKIMNSKLLELQKRLEMLEKK